MTSQLLNWVTVRGDQCSENVASFSDKSILSLIGLSDIVGPSDIVGLSDIVAFEFSRQHRWPAIG